MKTRGFATAAAVALIATLCGVASAQAADGSWRHGWCREDEGLSVVVDYGPEGMAENPHLALPVEGWDIRCLVGGEITVDDDYTRITALNAVGFAVEGDGYVTGINGVSSGNGFWMFAGADIGAGEAWSQDQWNIARYGTNTNIAVGVRYSSDWNDFVPRPNAVFGSAGRPSTPAAPSVTLSGPDAVVTWSQVEGNGAEVTDYSVTLTPSTGAALTQRVQRTSATFTGLAAGNWTATVVATNAAGDSTRSPASVGFVVTAPTPAPSPTPTPGATSLQASTPQSTWGTRASTTVVVGGRARGTVTGTLGGRTLKAAVTNGRAVLRWPAKAQRPGTGTARITFTSADNGIHADASTTTRVSVSKASAKVRVSAAKATVKRSKRATFTVRVAGTAGDTATGKVRVRFRGATKTVALKRGRAVVKVKASRTLGKASATVTYLGDRLHTSRTAKSAKVRTVR